MNNIWLNPVIKAYRDFFQGDANVIFDIGTRDGDDAEFFRQELGAESCRVVCIDANPKAVESTKKRYPNFEVLETAVSNYTGRSPFIQVNSPDKNEAGTSSLSWRDESSRLPDDGSIVKIFVAVTTMRDIVESLGLADQIIDVAKVDVESYTYEVLVGWGDLLKQVKVVHLETERKGVVQRASHRNNRMVAKFMRHRGFHLVDVSYEWGWGIQDQVWVNKNLLDIAVESLPPEIDETK